MEVPHTCSGDLRSYHRGTKDVGDELCRGSVHRSHTAVCLDEVKRKDHNLPFVRKSSMQEEMEERCSEVRRSVVDGCKGWIGGVGHEPYRMIQRQLAEWLRKAVHAWLVRH